MMLPKVTKMANEEAQLCNFGHLHIPSSNIRYSSSKKPKMAKGLRTILRRWPNPYELGTFAGPVT